MGKYKRLPENYFKLTNPVVISFVCVGLYLLLMAWLDPENISPTFFGRVADLATWLGLEYNNAVKQIGDSCRRDDCISILLPEAEIELYCNACLDGADTLPWYVLSMVPHLA
ncbi:uncharacterized protein LOC123517075 isoform X2 [Portunus trituberculatus]|uniref:uncharacterized protein LOC123517075 isoform X2 n=1 Tax=Portunus trituberculatus TaxID=210409 RepID=UPI001E1CB956|nr:uncharacterized protein LOC123517075 isoform X2 [Portunus trituberculatus]